MQIRITLPPPASPNRREIPLAFSPKIRKTCPLFAIFAQQHGLERTDCWGSHGLNVRAFLWMAHAKSGFKDRIRRMQCDQNRELRASRVDSCQQVGNWFEASYKPVWITSGLPRMTILATSDKHFPALRGNLSFSSKLTFASSWKACHERYIPLFATRCTALAENPLSMHFATRARARLRLRLTIRPAIFAFWSVITVAELILQCCALGAMGTGVFPVCASERKRWGRSSDYGAVQLLVRRLN